MDIDIDCSKSLIPENIFPGWVRASTVERDMLRQHVVGGYFQKIPKDRITGLAAIPYKTAESLGYMKIDFLHLTLLDKFKSKKDVIDSINTIPNWSLLEDREIVSKLFHISKHYDLVSTVRPKSVETLADVLMLIRPSKIHLQDKYINNPNSVKKILYKKEIDSDLRRSHAIAYALNIVLQLNSIGKNNESDRAG